MKAKRILVVDDEPAIQRILRRNLIASGYEVQVAEDGTAALDIIAADVPDLILLDLCLPGEIDGIGVCKRVREWTQTPIIVLSARTEEKQKVLALDLGADDYLTKPFSTEELLARVRACLRRAQILPLSGPSDHSRDGAGPRSSGGNGAESTPEPEILRSDDGYVSMNVMRRQVRVGNTDVKLTPTEFELLRQLMTYAGKVLTHRSLLRAVWGPEYGEEADYLRVYIRQLRLKVEEQPSQPRYILTEPGVGYVFHSQRDSDL